MDGPDGFRAAGGMRSMPSTPLRHGPQSRPLLSAGISVSAAGILHSLAAGRARMERQQPASSHGTPRPGSPAAHSTPCPAMALNTDGPCRDPEGSLALPPSFDLLSVRLSGERRLFWALPARGLPSRVCFQAPSCRGPRQPIPHNPERILAGVHHQQLPAAYHGV